MTFWTLLLAIWTVLCWNAWKAKAAESQGNPPLAAPSFPEEKTVLLDVPCLDQRDKYPTGCESVSAVMVLRYFGADLTVDRFIDGYLPLGSAPAWNDGGEYVGCDPRKAFPGDPRQESGWGCYAPVIRDALERLFSDRPDWGLSVKDLTGLSLDELCGEYVDQGLPVLVWGTIGMEEPCVSDTFLLEGTGESFQWIYPMHCLVLVGYDGENYFFNDPMEGKGIAYPRDKVERAYEGLGKQALAVT